MGLVHTHRHSEYSLLDGVGTAQQYAQRAAELGQSALAQTDHGNLCGVLHHYTACKTVGIKPILGVEAYFSEDRFKKDSKSVNYHLILLAQNKVGWQNLIRLVSEAYNTGFYYKPRVDYDLLNKYSEGLFCGNACVNSIINRHILLGDASQYIEQFLDIFGERFYLELMPHDFDEQRFINSRLIEYGEVYSIPILATVDAHTPYKEWTDTQDIVIMMATQQTFADRKKKKEAGEDTYLEGSDTLYLMSEDELKETFVRYHKDIEPEYVEKMIDNTQILADKVEEFEINKSRKMPKVRVNSELQIKEWCEDSLFRLGKSQDKEYLDRYEYELSVLKENNVLDYFVIVGDLVRWAKENGVRVGAGRGSAAGSLISYLIGITQLDPIAHGLLFERFLNPDRKGLPDIDLDFSSERREEVKAYAGEKWGKYNVADICSFQTYKPKAAIQKVGRVYNLYEDTMKATKDIPVLASEDIEELRGIYPALDSYAKKHPDAWKHSRRVQGQVHTLSKHAGGVVITDKPLYEYMPTMLGNDKQILTQWGAKADFNIVDDYGFMKIDLLGITGLDTQELACRFIKERHGVDVDLNSIDVMSDPYAVDSDVLRAFTNGLVLGVWQFTGSPGFEGLIKSFRPEWLGDLAAANAIYRPGPLGGKVNVSYARRKFGLEEVEYFHESVRDVLSETFGLIVYQEQIMELVKRMANFSGSDADGLRKAISKEYRLGITHVKEYLKDNGYVDQWYKGCKSNDISDPVAQEVWRLILAFGDYGFNKSHAYAYAVQSYQDMWIKVNYPTEFYSAFLTYNPDEIIRVLREATYFDVNVKLPDINRSQQKFTIEDNEILFGLGAVKNLGKVGVNEILEKRPFSSYEDFCERVKPRAVNSRAKKSLIDSGAFDSFLMRKDMTDDFKGMLEKEAIGVGLSNKRLIKEYSTIIESNFNNENVELAGENEGVAIGGEITRAKRIKTKRGQKMGFFTLQHKEYEWYCTVFPDSWGEYEDLIAEGNFVMLRGRKDSRNNGQVSVIVDVMCSVQELIQETYDAKGYAK